MKSRITLLCLALLVAGVVSAQKFPTNNISQEQAIKITERLRAGMNMMEVWNMMEKTNGLRGATVGSMGGHTTFYVLSNGCHLNLEFRPKGSSISSSNFWLSTAFISHGQKLVTIIPTNAP